VSSFDRVIEWVGVVTSGKNLNEELSRLDRANRLIVMHDEPVQEIADQVSIRAIAALVQRHRQHWVAISGVFADYDFVFFDNGTQLGSVGISKGFGGDDSRSTINYGDYYQPAAAEEVASLANRLALKWPNRRK
jgi:hypothetical protein